MTRLDVLFIYFQDWGFFFIKNVNQEQLNIYKNLSERWLDCHTCQPIFNAKSKCVL